jgi:hypothetical protein
MASDMGWGATRAWRAEAKLRGACMIRFEGGKGVPQFDGKNVEGGADLEKSLGLLQTC